MTTYPDFSKCHVIVVGDVMLDVYLWGDVERISPEAPVPVVRIREKTRTMGGAGNVMLNLTGLKCPTTLIGVRGGDVSGQELSETFARKGIRDDLIVSANVPTTTKTRIIGQGQQLVRLDEEDPSEISPELQQQVLDRLDTLLPDAGAVIISDYGKGMFKGTLAQDIIRRCRPLDIPVFVDPKGNDWERYRGAACITPNLNEFHIAAPFDKSDQRQLEQRARCMIDELALSNLMVTRGPQGMSLFIEDSNPIHIPAEAREVFDVSGAGDTVISVLAAGVAAGLTVAEAAELANTAAGIVVGKIGTQPISCAELKTAVKGRKLNLSGKFCDLAEATRIITGWKEEGKRVVFTNGCFDILHIGHIKILHAAAEEGDKLVVGLNSDASVKRLKGDCRPVMPEEDRAALLASIRCVDMVVIFEQDTPIELITAFEPDVIVKGGDYTPETVVGNDIVVRRGGKTVIIPLVDGMSTTHVIQCMKSVQ